MYNVIVAARTALSGIPDRIPPSMNERIIRYRRPSVGSSYTRTPLSDSAIFRNVGIQGGPAPVRAYIPALLEDVLAGTINPGRVFDFETDLEHVADAYAAMDGRTAIKSLLRTTPTAWPSHEHKGDDDGEVGRSTHGEGAAGNLHG